MTNLEKFFTDHNTRVSAADTVTDMVALRRTRGMSVRDVAELIAATIDGIPLDFGNMTAVTGTLDWGGHRIKVTVQSVESTESNTAPVPIATVFIGRSQHTRIAWCQWGES